MNDAYPQAPAVDGVHPVLLPDSDPVSLAVCEALDDWPAVHEALKAARVANAEEMAETTSTTDVGTGE